MLKFVKEGALDILALTLPSSLLESIRQISEEDLLPPPPPLSHKQRQPRARTQKQAFQNDKRASQHVHTPHHPSASPQESPSNPGSTRQRHWRKSKNKKRRATCVASQEHNPLLKDPLVLGQEEEEVGLQQQQQASCERPLKDSSSDPAKTDDQEGWWRQPPLSPNDSDDNNPLDPDDPDYDSIEVESDYDSDLGDFEEQQQQHRRIQDLPYEVLAHILGFLPASDLMTALSVCRQWRRIALLETRQVDISECFPQDCLGLDSWEEYSDFEFVVHLFSTFPLVSTILIKERYLRDRDLRVVTAGILAGKMAFTHWNPHFAELERDFQQHLDETSTFTQELSGTGEQSQHSHSETQDQDSTGLTATVVGGTRIIPKIMRGSIKEELSRFSKSVARYVLVPQTRNTLRKKILAQLQVNLEQKHQQDYWWMIQEGFHPQRRPPVDAATITEKHALVPITHYRFQDCCFANDWGANMDLNKLPMIGLAAAISHQGLFVDLDGSYGAPSKSVKTMLGFCFGPNCVISLAFGFQHTHMELEHVTEMIAENSILYRMDIVDAPAYQDLIFLPALRGLGRLGTEMQRCCLELDEPGLQRALQEARTVFLGLAGDLRLAEEMMECEQEAEAELNKDRDLKAVSTTEDRSSSPLAVGSRLALLKSHGRSGGEEGLRTKFVNPIDALAEQLVFPSTVKPRDRHRTARVLLQSVVSQGLKGLLSTRDKTTGQALLHTLAWRRHYSSTMARLESEEEKEASSSTPSSLSLLLRKQKLQPKEREGRRKRVDGKSLSTTTSAGATTAAARSTSMDSIFSVGPSHRTMSSEQQQQHGSQQSGQGSTAEPAEQGQPRPSSSRPMAIRANESAGLLSTTPPSFASLRAALPAALSFPLTFRRRSLPLVWFGTSPPTWGSGHGSDSSSDESSSTEPHDSEGEQQDEQEEAEVEGLEQEEDGDLGHFPKCYQGEEEEEEETNNNVDKDGQLAITEDRLLVEIPWNREERRQLARLHSEHPILVALRMAKALLDQGADPNVYNNDGRPAAVCASFMGFQPMETLLVRHGGVLKELTRIRETM